VGRLQIRAKPNGPDFGVYFLFGFNSLAIIVSNSTHSPPTAIEIGALGGALRMIPSTLPRAVNRVLKRYFRIASTTAKKALSVLMASCRGQYSKRTQSLAAVSRKWQYFRHTARDFWQFQAAAGETGRLETV
jgi:hypothetical protein